MPIQAIYAGQFFGVMDKPDRDKIEGISPAIAIDQRKGGRNPHSTVGTITEVCDSSVFYYWWDNLPNWRGAGIKIGKI